jgi:hypothetical protein
MIKMLFGAAVVVALVGYGVITTQDVEDAGARIKNGVNYVAQELDKATRND